MATRTLRAAPDDGDEPKRGRTVQKKPANQAKRPPKLAQSRRDTLVKLRAVLEKRIADAPDHAIARLIGQFSKIDEEIRVLDAKAERDATEADTEDDDSWDDDEV